MAFGSKDAKGIYQYGEDDNEVNHSTLLNKLATSVSDATKHFSGTPAQRTALTPAPDGAFWVDTDTTGRAWRGIGGDWEPLGTDRILGTHMTGQLLAGTAWTDLATVTARSYGREVIATAMAWSFNATSGADRAVAYRIVCDSTVITPELAGTQTIPLTGAPRIHAVMGGKSTPSSATHTWKLQISASEASAVFCEASMLTVTERGM